VTCIDRGASRGVNSPIHVPETGSDFFASFAAPDCANVVTTDSAAQHNTIDKLRIMIVSFYS
jgi:hypothetical protein